MKADLFPQSLAYDCLLICSTAALYSYVLVCRLLAASGLFVSVLRKQGMDVCAAGLLHQLDVPR